MGGAMIVPRSLKTKRTQKIFFRYLNALKWYVPVLFIKQKSVDVRDS